MSACPICGWELLPYPNMDAALCLKDGVMTGLQLVNLRGQPKHVIVAEVRAAQALRHISYLADRARQAIP